MWVKQQWGLNMTKLSLAAFVAIAFSASTATAQVSEDLNVDLTVTAQPQITVTPPNDVSFSSDGTTAPVSSKLAIVCFETNLTDLRLTVAKLNPINNGAASLVNAPINDYINYGIFGGVDGVLPHHHYTVTDTQDLDLTSANTGGASCNPTEIALALSLSPVTDPQPATRAVIETVDANGLDDGTPYVFSDVLTITFEPAL